MRNKCAFSWRRRQLGLRGKKRARKGICLAGRRHGIVALFPELSTPGGVQRAGGLTAGVLELFAAGRGEACTFLSLNDAPSLHRFHFGAKEITFRGYGRSKIRFLAGHDARRDTAGSRTWWPHSIPIWRRQLLQ